MDITEAARYLTRGREATEELLRSLRETGDALERAVTPRLTYLVLRRTPEGCEGIALPGEDVRALLKDADRVIAAACTLGEAAARFIRRAFALDAAGGVMADACASALADGEMARFEKEMTLRYREAGLYLTDRFSPGYGDLPLTAQKDICAALDAEKRLGLRVNGSMLLVPEKSVTAVIGICPVPQRHRAIDEAGGCRGCAAFGSCEFQRQGRTCHG